MVSKSHSVVSAAGSKDEFHSWFGVRTCQSMLESLLALDDIDVDILVLLRDEVIPTNVKHPMISKSCQSSSLTKHLSISLKL
jgi:hypothetical protein